MRTSRKEREKQERREEIFDAAKVVFARKGFAATTMEEVAEKAQLSKGAVYLYFKSKEDLLISLIENYLDNLTLLIKNIVESKKTPVDKLGKIVLQILSYLQTNKEFTCIFSPERGEFLHKMQKKTIRERTLSKLQNQTMLIAQSIQEGIRLKVFRKIDPLTAASAIFGMIHTIIATSIIYERPASKKAAQTIIDMFLNGIKLREE